MLTRLRVLFILVLSAHAGIGLSLLYTDEPPVLTTMVVVFEIMFIGAIIGWLGRSCLC